ncbi:MAG: potassium channel family protein [Rhodospirillaceae bacterium]|nr:potassium channel family protein [Rhodospirillaceae bacterium]
MLLATAISVVLLATTILTHYEALRLVSRVLPGPERLGLRRRMVLVTLACFVAHVLEVLVYALAYYVFADDLKLGSLTGDTHNRVFDFLYFSATTFTSLGIGDIYPIGPTRIVAAVESLNGLLLIAWSASFTYLVMRTYWSLDSRGDGGPLGKI